MSYFFKDILVMWKIWLNRLVESGVYEPLKITLFSVPKKDQNSFPTKLPNLHLLFAIV